MAGVFALATAHWLWVQCDRVVFVADAEFIRAWRENRP